MTPNPSIERHRLSAAPHVRRKGCERKASKMRPIAISRMALAASACLFLAFGNTAFSGTGFTFPALASQPAKISRVAHSASHYELIVFNRSPKTIRDIEFVFAGTTCSPPYKPAWPGKKHEGPAVPPGAYISIKIQGALIDGVAARSLASCGYATPTEIAITYIRFADGTNWNLGERVRSGEQYEKD